VLIQYYLLHEPWNLIKDGKNDKAMALVALITNIIAKVALLLDSVMPHKIKDISTCLGIEISTLNYNKLILNNELLNDVKITKIDALFPRVEDILLAQPDVSDITVLQKDESKYEAKDEPEALDLGDLNLITIDKFFETTIKVGTIIEAVEVPKSSKLLKLQVDLGENRPRQVVAGIKEFYSASELVGTQACVVANLKPAKLMGLLSEGMLLAAKDENGLSLIRPEKPKKIGTKIS
jgi:methionyl-tRNA synthetase